MFNYDLYKRNVIAPPNCACVQNEDICHLGDTYVFQCPRYIKRNFNARNSLFDKISTLRDTILIYIPPPRGRSGRPFVSHAGDRGLIPGLDRLVFNICSDSSTTDVNVTGPWREWSRVTVAVAR